MLIKANVSFAGDIVMRKGEERELEASAALSDLAFSLRPLSLTAAKPPSTATGACIPRAFSVTAIDVRASRL